jgi:biopolymer transport protein ExbD
MKIQQQEIRKARIEIIPMIDTIFFLLVFFIVSSLTMAKIKALNVAVPKPVSAANKAANGGAAHTYIVTVTAQGEYYINKNRIDSAAGLSAALTNRLIADPAGIVVLNIDHTQTAQSMIDVMDTVHNVKTPSGKPVQIMIATEPIDHEGHAITSRLVTPGGGNNVP